MKKTFRNNNVDIFRLLASFFIVFLHTGFNNMNQDLEAVVRISGRWGVPFFFLLSGYYFQKSLINDPTRSVVKNCIKILNILIVADIVYIIALYLLDGTFNWRHIFPGAYFHLWFLPSLAIGTLAVYVFKKLNISFYITLSLSVLVIILVLVADSYSNLVHLPFPTRTGYVIPLLSIPYMTIGSCFYNKKWFKSMFTIKLGALLVIVGYLMQILEITLINIYTDRPATSHQYLIGTLFLSVGIFILAFSVNLKNELLGKWGKDYSLFIYLFHPLIILFFYHINYKVVFKDNIIVLFPVLIFFVTLMFAILTDKYLPNLFLALNGSIRQSFNNLKNKRVPDTELK